MSSRAPEDELRQAGRRRTFSRGEVVFHEGDPGDSLHRVTRGRFAARVTTPLGDVATFAVHAPGDVFGLLAVLHPEARRTATVAALERGETFALPASAFARLRAAHPGVAVAVEQLLVEMLTDGEQSPGGGALHPRAPASPRAPPRPGAHLRAVTRASQSRCR